MYVCVCVFFLQNGTSGNEMRERYFLISRFKLAGNSVHSIEL